MKKLSMIEMIHLLLGANIILWLNSGTYRLIVDAIPTVIKFGLVALWFAISILRSKSFLSRFAVVVYLLALFYLLCILSKLAGIDGYYTHYGMILLYVMIEIGIFCYYYCYGTKKELKFLLAVYFLDMAVILIRTFIMLQDDPDVVRLLSTSAEHKRAVFGNKIPKGIGAYAFCYELVLLQPLLAYFLNKKRAPFAVKVLIYGLILMFLFQAQITLALIMYPVLLLITYTFGQKKRLSHSLGKLLLAALSMTLIVLLPTILQELIRSSEAHLSARLEELYMLITAQDASGDDMQSRMVLYEKSLSAFFARPLWGAFGGNVYGAHSTFLDLLGAFGLLGLVGYLGIFRSFTLAKRDFANDKQALSVMRTTMYVTVFVSLINVIMSSDILLTLLVIVPLAMLSMKDGKEEKVNTDLSKPGAYTPAAR